MPTKLSRCLRREVVAVREGRALGRPANILVDPERGRVALLVLTYGAVPDTAVVARAGAVSSFESDTLAISGLDDLTIAFRDQEALELLEQGFDFRRRRVLTSAGKKLGRITDLLVDERGHVTQYIVRRGILGLLRLRSLKIGAGELEAKGGEVVVARDAGGESGRASGSR